jgi:hypothetical protein
MTNLDGFYAGSHAQQRYVIKTFLFNHHHHQPFIVSTAGAGLPYGLHIRRILYQSLYLLKKLT